SSTVVASGPTQSRVALSGTTPSSDTSPHDGFSPTRPQAAAGIRIDPPVSDPPVPRLIPVATEIADPPLDPPGERVVSIGWCAGPNPESSVVVPIANSCMLHLPTRTAPAARRCATHGASTRATSRIDRDPAVVTRPC